MSEYKNLKVSDLRDIAKSRGLKGWSRLRKDNLISFIIGNEDYPSDRAMKMREKWERGQSKSLGL